MDAMILSWPKRAKSSGATTCACSTRSRRSRWPFAADDCGESIERDVVGAVADRVKGELKSGAVAFDGHGRELRFIHVQESGRVWRIGIWRE